LVKRLTDREREIELLIADGCKNAAIARRLGLSPRAVGSYVQRIRQWLNLGSRDEIAAWVAARHAPSSANARMRRAGDAQSA
jgi:non-specific serine/threonine protein kinase